MFRWFTLILTVFALQLQADSFQDKHALFFAGSTRKNSDNKKLVIEAARIAKKLGAQVSIVDLRDIPIPLYDGDLEEEEGMPGNAAYLRAAMIASNVIFIASPNYNHAPSGVLKNALDWASRDEWGGSSRDAFKGKTFALMCASPGASGGVKGLPAVREIITTIGGNVIADEIGIPKSSTAFDENGRIKDPELKARLEKLVEAALKYSGES